jgi:hypothetical protein
MRELFGRNVEKHIPSRQIAFGPTLRKVTHCGRQLAVWAPELIEEQFGKKRVRPIAANRILHPFVM